jgi:hypothetical protein
MDLLALDARIRASHLAPVQLHGQPASWVLADRLEALAAFPQFMDEHVASPVAVNAAFVKLANAFQRRCGSPGARAYLACHTVVPISMFAAWSVAPFGNAEGTCRFSLIATRCSTACWPHCTVRVVARRVSVSSSTEELLPGFAHCLCRALGILAPITRQRLDVAYYVGDYLNREIYDNHEHALAAMSTLDALCGASKKAAAIVYRDIHRYAGKFK